MKTCTECKIEKDEDCFYNSRSKCKKCIKEYNKQYRIEHKEERRKKNRAEKKENKKENKNENKKNRKKTDPAFKLRNNVSISVNKALRSNGSSKNGKSILKHLPYTIEELKQYLELLFESWMSWGNHGKYNAKTWDEDDQSTWVWNIEHITPQAQLPYTSMEDNNFKKCWELENLRPYNAKKNIEEKNNRSQEEISKIKNDIKEHLEKLKS